MLNWSVVRLIAAKEFRDLLRDRRTVLLILALPPLMYVLFGAGAGVMLTTLMRQKQVLGVVGADHLPAAGYPPFPPDLAPPDEPDPADPTGGVPTKVSVEPLAGDPDELLRTRKADAVLVVPPDFAADLLAGRKPTLTVRGREGEDKSKAAVRRLVGLVRKWEGQLREKRFADRGLPKDFDKLLTVEDPRSVKPKDKLMADEARDGFARIFPFILLMWLVAGAIQPAVDMTAGEKERGTMETLLISPAERGEIVTGKFVATTAFAFGSVVWNVIWVAAAAAVSAVVWQPVVNFPGLLACVVLGLPLAMLFSAVCLALGVFAQSTKEGQYYLMPLIFAAMPLAFYGLLPGAELTPGNCWVPVTGAVLLQARLLAVSGEPLPGWAFPAVLGSLSVWVGLALFLASWQFRREAVLFREAAGKGLKGLFGGR